MLRKVLLALASFALMASVAVPGVAAPTPENADKAKPVAVADSDVQAIVGKIGDAGIEGLTPGERARLDTRLRQPSAVQAKADFEAIDHALRTLQGDNDTKTTANGLFTVSKASVVKPAESGQGANGVGTVQAEYVAKNVLGWALFKITFKEPFQYDGYTWVVTWVQTTPTMTMTRYAPGWKMTWKDGSASIDPQGIGHANGTMQMQLDLLGYPFESADYEAGAYMWGNGAWCAWVE